MLDIKRRLALIIALMTPGLLWAQTVLTGTVADAENQEALPYASLVIGGQHRGTVTNLEGRYSLDARSLKPTDSIHISYIGYKTQSYTVKELSQLSMVEMHPATVNLASVSVYSRSLTTKEIMEQVEERFEKNHPPAEGKQRIFFHKYGKTPFSDKNKLHLKESDLPGVDASLVSQVMDMMPEEFVEYQDALVDLYRFDGDEKLKPIQGISLEEGSQRMLAQTLEEKLSVLTEDLEKSFEDEDVYYKLRMGILGFKLDEEVTEDSVGEAQTRDTVNYPIETSSVHGELRNIMRTYTRPSLKELEFITERQRYRYKREGIVAFDNELVYQLSFTPKRKGLYNGNIYVSTETFAVLQMDFEFAPGKVDEKIQVLGFGHAMNYKGARVIFEREGDAYYLKYINARKKESISVTRGFALVKKKKRFLIDKELNEIKLEMELYFDADYTWEVLVMDRQKLSEKAFDDFEEPEIMNFKKEYVFNPDVWQSGSVIMPTQELKGFKRK